MRILLVILLKIVEIAVIVFLPHYLGRLVCLIPAVDRFRFRIVDDTVDDTESIPYWVMGLMIILILFLLGSLIAINWDWAGSILGG